MILTRNMFIDLSCYFDIDQGHSDRFKWCIVQTEASPGKPTAVPVCFRLQLWVFFLLFFFTPDAFILAVFPGICSFAYDWSVCFTAFFQFGFFFVHQYSRVRPTGDVTQPPIFFIIKLVMNFHVAVHSFYVPVCKHCSVTLCFIRGSIKKNAD